MNQHAKRRAQSRRQAGHPSAGYIDPIDMLDEGEAAPAPSFHRSTATQVAPEGLTPFVIGPEPVSYTHLDVYKRQATSGRKSTLRIVSRPASKASRNTRDRA